MAEYESTMPKFNLAGSNLALPISPATTSDRSDGSKSQGASPAQRAALARCGSILRSV